MPYRRALPGTLGVRRFSGFIVSSSSVAAVKPVRRIAPGQRQDDSHRGEREQRRIRCGHGPAVEAMTTSAASFPRSAIARAAGEAPAAVFPTEGWSDLGPHTVIPLASATPACAILSEPGRIAEVILETVGHRRTALKEMTQ